MNIYKLIKHLLRGAALATALFVSAPLATEAKSFTDLNSNGVYTEALTYFNNLGVFDYITSNTLNANAPVTRAEASKILYNLNKDTLTVKRNYNNNFSDIKPNTQYAEAIIWSFEVGIFDGDESKKFNPNATLTRGQMAKILVSTFNLTSENKQMFKDVKSNHWAYKYVNILAENGITAGEGNYIYAPESKVTLAQLSTFMHRIKTGTKVVVKPYVAPITTKEWISSFDEIKQIALDLYNSNATKWSENNTIELKSKVNLSKQMYDYFYEGTDIYVDFKGYTPGQRDIEVVEVITFIGSKKFEDYYTYQIYVEDLLVTEEEYYAWEQKLDSYVSQIKQSYPLNTDYDVVWAVNDFVINNFEYGQKNPRAAKGHDFVCHDYANVTTELLTRFGIPVSYIGGYITQNGTKGLPHAWNVVQVGGQWYHLDTTFNDKTYNKNQYFLLTEEQMALDHKVDRTKFKASSIPFDQSMALPYTVK